METLAMRHVCVWLDGLAPGQGAFAHALDWAARLGLPLRGMIPSLGTWDGPAGHTGGEEGPQQEGSPITASAEQREACETVCQSRGVTWMVSPWQGHLRCSAGYAPPPAELCVWGDFLPSRLKEELLRQSWQDMPTALLVCPRSWRPVTRVLVLDQQHEADTGFLASAVAVSRAFQVEPVVLTVARSEREARLRQRAAQEALAARRWPADFDFIVGCDVRTAVTWAARWRRCTHVFVERRPGPAWSRWLQADPLRRLLDLSADLTFLALPGGGRPLPDPSDVRPFTAGRAARQSP